MDIRLPQEKEFTEKLGIMDPLKQNTNRRSNTRQIQARGYLWGKRIGESGIPGP